MNKDKVYLKGYVIGRAADTLGYKGLMVQLENLDIVEIDKNLVHKDINEPQLLKLKDIIARIKGFDSGTRKVWLDGILGELGSEYGSLKYKQGYDQGKFEGGLAGVERAWNKPVVPQFVADWYEENKDDFETKLFNEIDLLSRDLEDDKLSEFEEWLVDNHTEPFQTLVNMHQFGYDVKKERRYTVKMRTTKQPLFYNSLEKRLFFSLGELATQFTFKQLEEAGFGEVFNSPLFEVEEVEG